MANFFFNKWVMQALAKSDWWDSTNKPSYTLADVTWSAAGTNLTQVHVVPYGTAYSASAVSYPKITWLEDKLLMSVEKANALNNAG